jgi:hypothetical protein
MKLTELILVRFLPLLDCILDGMYENRVLGPRLDVRWTGARL